MSYKIKSLRGVLGDDPMARRMHQYPYCEVDAVFSAEKCSAMVGTKQMSEDSNWVSSSDPKPTVLANQCGTRHSKHEQSGSGTGSGCDSISRDSFGEADGLDRENENRGSRNDDLVFESQATSSARPVWQD